MSRPSTPAPLAFSPNIRELQPSATIAVSTLCRAMRDEGREVIDLSAGEPDFRTPDFAAQAGIASIVQGFTHYTATPGLPALRKLIAEHVSRLSGIPADHQGVVVTCGAKHALFNTCFALFGPDDEVLVPSPYWTTYPELIRIARAEPVIVAATADAGFKVSVADLEAAATSRTRGLMLNSPNNPTGAVYTRDELEAIVAWAAERAFWVISDEIYGRLCYTGTRAASVYDLDPALLDRVVLIDGASKAFAMTGWRLGFSYSSPELAAKMTALQSHITSNIATATQYAGIAVFRDEPRVQHAIRAMLGVFRHRRDRLVTLLRRHLPQARFIPPDGAFYMFFQVDNFYRDGIADSIGFCKHVLEKTGVALVPGAAFGEDRFVRLSFTAAEDELVEAVRRMGALLSVPAYAD
ncbi:MAG: pyridoxal phosphate-dependent aminotransferase [Longimicrobiales bacterium]